MSARSPNITAIPLNLAPGAPLQPWTYDNTEVFDLEYEALFLRRWQFAGHCNDLPASGDYITLDIGRDNIIVLRDTDMQLRAFLNVCRHRASRILIGTGNCGTHVQCPYHGWSYGLDGKLKGVPQQKNFQPFDRSEYGLHPVQLEVFNGLIFTRVKGDGAGIAEQFAHTAHYLEKYDVANYSQLSESTVEIWDVNWKIVWDNYLENYHLPVGHPGLNRLVQENDEYEELSSGVGYGVFVMNEVISTVDEERMYQEQIHLADHRVPEDLKGRWVQFGISPNLGIDFYPEMLDMFQIIPLELNKTMVRASFYGHANPTPEETELRRLNRLINDPINEEDRQLCTRVQQGLLTHGYQPGPLSSMESGVFNFHELIRQSVPVTTLKKAPSPGSVATENTRLKTQAGAP
ncbi:MAG: phenylpropionate dioxygenase-like ring-hydroxylating dioxygenase large terminal subunit [Halieaceae bacterium]|jgi:phenylpropionate dioxygenase-like ring-hydroxylating dioxygenase large terminal subunit